MKKKFAFIIALLVIALLFLFAPLLFGTRALTPDEHTRAYNIYESSVVLDDVRIKIGGPLTWAYPGVTVGNVVSFPKGEYDETSREDQALFIHEVAHVWQYQHFGWGYIPRSLWETFTQSDTYVVHYDPDLSFLEYDVEEQAEIVAEYFLSNGETYKGYIDELRGVE